LSISNGVTATGSIRQHHESQISTSNVTREWPFDGRRNLVDEPDKYIKLPTIDPFILNKQAAQVAEESHIGHQNLIAADHNVEDQAAPHQIEIESVLADYNSIDATTDEPISADDWAKIYSEKSGKSIVNFQDVIGVVLYNSDGIVLNIGRNIIVRPGQTNLDLHIGQKVFVGKDGVIKLLPEQEVAR
jgi:hypothetical protein